MDLTSKALNYLALTVHGRTPGTSYQDADNAELHCWSTKTGVKRFIVA